MDTVLDAVKHGIKRETDRAAKKMLEQNAVDGVAVIEEYPAIEG